MQLDVKSILYVGIVESIYEKMTNRHIRLYIKVQNEIFVIAFKESHISDNLSIKGDILLTTG